MQLKFDTDSVCANNAIGGSISQFAQGTLQTVINGQVRNGAISLMLELIDPNPTGVHQSNIHIGVLAGSPEQPQGSPTYNGSADTDWWYAPDTNSVTDAGAPLTQLLGDITNHTLTLGPGALSMNLSLGNGGASIDLSNTTLVAPIGTLTKPKVTTNGLPPGHLPSEHIDPNLKTFASTGTGNGGGGGPANTTGTLCGNMSASSLAQLKLPAGLITVCTNQNYTTNNSLLDLLVGGCGTQLGSLITATQPDQSDPDAPAAGAGAPYTLAASNNTTKAVDGCKDKNGADVGLNRCLAAAAYSSYFNFSTNRVFIRH